MGCIRFGRLFVMYNDQIDPADAAMRIFLSGATGFLGRALLLALRHRGHHVVAWVRDPERARDLLGAEAELLPVRADDGNLVAALERCEAVINLAGEPILSRWSAARRAALRASRVDLTARLVRGLAACGRRPAVLLSGSAVGYYGDGGAEQLTETSGRGTGFLAELCADWEAAARAAEALGTRVVLLRTGVVLGLDGGALPTMLPPFRFGLGGRVGSGRQYMPWIHVEDWVRAVLFALENERVRGPLNLAASEATTNRDYTTALGRALGKPTPFPVPGFALKLLFGGAASLLLASQRVHPASLLELGFRFRFARLEAALADLLLERGAELAPREPGPLPDSAYLAARPPTMRLTAVTELDVPLDEAFRFFSASENLALLTPRALAFRTRARSGPPGVDATIDYGIRLGPIPLRWRTRFEVWERERRFVDVQERGPYSSWWHEHGFEPLGTRTRMHDRVLYGLPLGLLGRLAHRLFVADQLGDIFAQRALAVRLRFGRPGAREHEVAGA